MRVVAAGEGEHPPSLGYGSTEHREDREPDCCLFACCPLISVLCPLSYVLSTVHRPLTTTHYGYSRHIRSRLLHAADEKQTAAGGGGGVALPEVEGGEARRGRSRR